MKTRSALIILSFFGLAQIGCAPAGFSKFERQEASTEVPVEPTPPPPMTTPTPSPTPLASPTPSPTPIPSPTPCPGIQTDPNGCIKAECKGGVANPRVEVSWCLHPQANSNSLQKGDMHPGDPNRFWDWLYQGPNFSYTDRALVVGETYYYRVKHRPELASSTIILPINACTCGN